MAELQTVTIRRARLHELARLSQLERRVWKELAASYTELRRRFFLFPQAFQVAIIAPEIAGFCCGFLSATDATKIELNAGFPGQHVAGGKYLFLVALTVNPIFRRRGVASRLLERELEVGHRLQCRKVQLVANAFSRPLFEKYAFRAVTVVDRLFGDYAELMPQPVLMEKLLQGR